MKKVKERKVKTSKLGAIQGDVPILRVAEIPADAKPSKNRRVAEGETTGHNHEVRGEVQMYESLAGYFFEVAVGKPVEIVHTSNGEHDAIEMTPGVYFVPREAQVEYDGEKERRAMD